MNDELAKELRHFNVLMEDQNGKLDAILEGQKDQATRADIAELRQDVTELKRDMKVVKAAFTATNHDLKKHKSLPAHVAHGHA
jgi:polyhydroxyalkanoate synthesis regulator phasin